jgi:mono/diheme cytochrome c family protein
MARKAWLGGAAATVLVSALVLAGCGTWSHGGGPQGWDDTARGAWYQADQGSRLMPLGWFKALEQPDAGAGKPFADPAYLANFRILPPFKGQSLPIGFGINKMDDSQLVKTSLHWTGAKTDQIEWVGLNCAACHTAQISYNNQPMTIDGAPSLFDFQTFVEAIDKSLGQTRDSAAAAPGSPAGARWERFAKAVLSASGDSPAARQALLRELNKLIDWQTQQETLNHSDSRYGPGRVDAVGHIFNRVLLYGGAAQPNPNPADAPVSYPHLWYISKQSQLQWDGIVHKTEVNIGATPTDFGAIGRNVGEVLGVFGEAVIKPPSGPTDLSGFVNTARVDNLSDIEVLLTKLEPPPWPKAFPAPGEAKINGANGQPLSAQQVVDAGKALFGTQCAQCHTPQPAQAGRPATYEQMKTFADLGPNVTDEWMACNAWAYTGPSGALAGIPSDYAKGEPIKDPEQVATLLATTVKGSLVNKKGQVVSAVLNNIFGVTPLPSGGPHFALPGVIETPKQLRLRKCQQNASNALLAYKARPLEGIWATAPYLHNGSVPTLYDLLQAPENRPVTFAMGTRAFDPKKVGYDTSPGAPGNSFLFDTRLAGNSNKGHVYGVGALTADQRSELLEYLKTL